MKINKDKLSKSATVKAVIKKPAPEKKPPPFEYPGDKDVITLLGPVQAVEVGELIKKFHQRYGCKLTFVNKFKSFKIFKSKKHVDWIDLNELMKRYDCRIAPVARPLQKAQRPYDKTKQVY